MSRWPTVAYLAEKVHLDEREFLAVVQPRRDEILELANASADPKESALPNAEAKPESREPTEAIQLSLLSTPALTAAAARAPSPGPAPTRNRGSQSRRWHRSSESSSPETYSASGSRSAGGGRAADRSELNRASVPDSAGIHASGRPPRANTPKPAEARDNQSRAGRLALTALDRHDPTILATAPHEWSSHARALVLVRSGRLRWADLVERG